MAMREYTRTYYARVVEYWSIDEALVPDEKIGTLDDERVSTKDRDLVLMTMGRCVDEDIYPTDDDDFVIERNV